MPREEELVGWAVIRTAHVVRRAVRAHTRDLGLTTQQFGLLGALVGAPGVSQAELARHLDLTPQALGGIVRGLEERGLVARETGGPGRAIRLSLTDEGRQMMLTRTAPVLEALRPERLGLDDDEARTLDALLARVRAHLST